GNRTQPRALRCGGARLLRLLAIEVLLGRGGLSRRLWWRHLALHAEAAPAAQAPGLGIGHDPGEREERHQQANQHIFHRLGISWRKKGGRRSRSPYGRPANRAESSVLVAAVQRDDPAGHVEVVDAL